MSSKLCYHGITVLSNTSGVLYQILVVLRKVDQIVVYKVYKVDRLTRCLSDFAKLVERLKAAGAVFVSVTQSFNTATSMGRLTLHMLLSFAQFEREVTAERIRDKIAASKRKGTMGWAAAALALSRRALGGAEDDASAWDTLGCRLRYSVERATPSASQASAVLSNPSRQLPAAAAINRSRRSLGDSGGSPEARRLFLDLEHPFPPERDDASGAHSHARVP